MNQVLELESVISAAEEMLRGEPVVPTGQIDLPYEIVCTEPTNQC
jgi:hypothetical protein